MLRCIQSLTFCACVTAAVAFSQETGSKPSATATAADPRTADRAAIRDELASFAKDFAARDAKKLAAHWTTDGEHQTVRGITIRGRAALEQGFAEFFAATPDVHAELQPEALRFLSASTAIDEGTVTIRKGPAALPERARYEALLVREENRWRLASLTESPADDVAISDLAWLIGEWKSTGAGAADIRTTYSWEANQKFLQAQFEIKEGERTLSGKQIIGIDPATGSLRSWTFGANGGVGEADWSRDGDHWTLDAAGSLPGGGTLHERNILRRVNADTFTWQSTERSLDDQLLPDLPPVKVTRIKSGK